MTSTDAGVAAVPTLTPRTRRLVWFGGWLLAATLIFVLARGLDLATLGGAWRRADGRWLVLAMLLYAAIQPVGAAQWRCLLPRGRAIPTPRILTLFSLTSLANNTTPSIIGHAAGAALLAAEPGIGPAAALSVTALDQLAVGISKILVLIVTLAVVDAPTWLTAGAWSLTALVAAFGIGLALSASQVARLTAWGTAGGGGRALGAALAFVARWASHLDALREPQRLAAGVACAVVARSLEGLAILAVLHAVGIGPTLAIVLSVLAATSLATVIPFSPAGLGTYEAGAYAAYRFLGQLPEPALAAAVIQHACGLVPAVGIGYVLLTVRRRV